MNLIPRIRCWFRTFFFDHQWRMANWRPDADHGPMRICDCCGHGYAKWDGSNKRSTYSPKDVAKAEAHSHTSPTLRFEQGAFT